MQKTAPKSKLRIWVSLISAFGFAAINANACAQDQPTGPKTQIEPLKHENLEKPEIRINRPDGKEIAIDADKLNKDFSLSVAFLQQIDPEFEISSGSEADHVQALLRHLEETFQITSVHIENIRKECERLIRLRPDFLITFPDRTQLWLDADLLSAENGYKLSALWALALDPHKAADAHSLSQVTEREAQSRVMMWRQYERQIKALDPKSERYEGLLRELLEHLEVTHRVESAEIEKIRKECESFLKDRLDNSQSIAAVPQP